MHLFTFRSVQHAKGWEKSTKKSQTFVLWDTIHRWITFVRMSTIWRETVITGCWPYLCKGERSSVSWPGSLVFGITPMMVLFTEVPFNKRLFTSCMFRGVVTLIRTVEPGNSTPSWVRSRGRRLGIWIPVLLDIVRLQRNRWREVFRAFEQQRYRLLLDSCHNKELRCPSKDNLVKRRLGKRANVCCCIKVFFWVANFLIDTQTLNVSISLLCQHWIYKYPHKVYIAEF